MHEHNIFYYIRVCFAHGNKEPNLKAATEPIRDGRAMKAYPIELNPTCIVVNLATPLSSSWKQS